MHIHLTNHVSSCNIGARCKVVVTPRTPLIPIHQAESPMEFIALDIAYMPVDTEGYQYVLLIGDSFSKYIEAVPMYKQTATDIVNVIWKHLLCRYGYHKFMLTDRGSNVVTIVKAMDLWTVIYDRYDRFRLPQFLWRNLLPSAVFSLNTTESAATKCSPFSVVYERKPVLSLDILMDTIPDAISAPTSKDYVQDLRVQITHSR